MDNLYREPHHVGAAVGGAVDLEAAKPRADEAREEGIHQVPRGMGPDREASSVEDQAHGLEGIEKLRGDEGGVLVSDEPVERLRDGGDMPGGDQDLGQVGAPQVDPVGPRRGLHVRKGVEHRQGPRITGAPGRVAGSGHHEHGSLGQRGAQELQAPGQRHQRAGGRVGTVEDVAGHHHHLGGETHQLLHRAFPGDRHIPLPHVHASLRVPVGTKPEVEIGEVGDDHPAAPGTRAKAPMTSGSGTAEGLPTHRTSSAETRSPKPSIPEGTRRV